MQFISEPRLSLIHAFARSTFSTVLAKSKLSTARPHAVIVEAAIDPSAQTMLFFHAGHVLCGESFGLSM